MPVRKPFPITTFERSLSFVGNIQSSGADGTIKRLTLLDLLNMRPGSSKTRDLISHSATYGLTKGSYNAEFIRLTEDGQLALNATDKRKQNEKHFELAISGIAPFNSVFEKFKGKSIPNPAVLKDELEAVGIAGTDTDRAMSTLLLNLRFLGAIKNVTGVEHIVEPEYDDIVIEAEDFGDDDSEHHLKTGNESKKHSDQSPPQRTPSLHIDVQVHIDSSATADQIDQIFKSMATHLYGNGHE